MTDQQPPPPPPPDGPPPAPPQSGVGWGGGWSTPRLAGPAPFVTYAGPGERLLAYIIDALIVGAVTTVLFTLISVLGAATVGVAGMAGSAGTGAFGFLAVFALFPLLIVVVYGAQLGYFAIFWYRGGATPGMRILGIRVVRSADGGPLTKQQAVLRAFGYWVSGAVLYLGFLWILIDDHRQGWHDKIADTVVVNAR